MILTKVDSLMLFGALLAALSSCSEKKQAPLGEWSSHSHSHYHGELRHAHPNTGPHTHQWMENSDRYRPYRLSFAVPLDVPSLVNRPEIYLDRSIHVRGTVTSFVMEEKHCHIRMAPLSGKGVGVLVNVKRAFCAPLRVGVGKTATVRGTFLVKDRVQIIEADNVEIEVADEEKHFHGGVDHSHPHNHPHGHGGLGQEVVP